MLTQKHPCTKNAPPEWNYNTPPPCVSGRSIKISQIYDSYNGPYINATNTIIPAQDVINSIPFSRGLMTIQEPIPTSWSWRNTGGNKIELPRNQGSCGGCWAFACATVLSDRYAIKYNIENQPLSTAWLISCGAPYGIKSNEECQCGGNAYLAGKWLEDNEIKLENCWPYGVISGRNYVSPNCLKELPDDCCASCCDPNNNIAKLKFKVAKNTTKTINILDVNKVKSNAEATTIAIQRDIMANGPVIASYQMSKEFENYWTYEADKGKIFIPTVPGTLGGHAVVLTGWGEENGIRYWEMRNSWGFTGDKGYCKFAFSIDTPNEENWSEIDIPKNIGHGWRGGVVSFEAGELPKTDISFPEGVGGKPVGNPLPHPTSLSKFIDWKNIDWVITNKAITVLVIIIVVSFYINKYF